MSVKETGRTTLCVLLAAIGTILLVLAFLVGLIEGIGFDKNFYAKEYAQNATSIYVGVSPETLQDATDALLDYLQGKRASLDLKTEINGSQREYYNEREKLHMADVRDLNLGALTFMWIGVIAGALLVVVAAVYAPKRYLIWGTYYYAILGILAAFGFIGIWAAIDFSSFWTSFHHVFFTNDLWLFDPTESLLIRMFEERFFFDMVGLILTWFLTITGASLLVFGLLYAKGKQEANAHKAAKVRTT